MQRRCIAVLLALIPLFLAASPALASRYDNPKPLPGWTHAKLSPDDSPQQHGILLPGARIVRSSPVIAEIDNNPADGKEVAVGGVDGVLYVYKSDGSLLWAQNVLPSTCTVNSGDWKLSSSPAVGAINGDGVPYVVVGYGSITNSDCDGGVVALRGTDGGLGWRFSTKAWGAGHGYSGEDTYGVLSSPSLADTDGDGKMEVGFGSFDHRVYLLNNDGSVRWYYNAADTVWSSPAFTDVNGDGRLDMVIGTDIAGKNPGGYVYAFDTQPRTPQAIAFNTGFIWQTFFEQAIFSSPVIADVLDSNAGNEVVIGSGCYRPTGTTDKLGKWVKILRLSDGAVLQTLNAPVCLSSSVAVGDLDDDGKLEIAATVMGAPALGGDGKSRIVAWKPTNPSPIWSTIPTNPNDAANDPYGADIQSPIIADVDGNGSLEVLAANFWSVIVLNGKTGAQLTCPNDSGGACGAQTSLFAWGGVKSTPAVGDINGDGVLDVVIGGCHVYYGGKCGGTADTQASGVLYAWTNLAGLINSPQGAQAAYSAPWAMFRGNASHTGAVPVARTLRLGTTSVGVVTSPRDPATTYAFTLTNPSDTAVSWTAASNVPWITVGSASGTATSTAPGTLTVTVNPAGIAPGSYQGTVTVTSDVGTQTLTVNLLVAAQVSRTYLPLSGR